MVSLNKLFAFVIYMSRKYRIDTSHSESHSMDVLLYAKSIYDSELNMFPELENQKNIIYTAAVLHDMCDKKYLNTNEGLDEIQNYFENELEHNDLDYAKEIMKTMSYSYVKKNGYPELGEYQLAYHVVREADLLASYNFDRSMIYHMNKGNTLTESYNDALNLFKNRVFTYNANKLLITDYSMRQSVLLTNLAINRINAWRNILINK
jgi:HD superfamily phosphodiesterase